MDPSPSPLTFFDCRNESIGCSGRGTCLPGANDAFICDCALFFEPSTYCGVSFFDTWKLGDLYHPIILLILTIFMGLLYSMEVVIDARRDIARLKKAGVIAKLTAIAFLLVRIVHYCIWLARDYHGFDIVPSIPDSVILIAGNWLALITMAFLNLGWIQLVIAAKQLGMNVNKKLLLYKKILIIAIGIAGPLLIIMYVIAVLPQMPAILLTVYNILLAVSLLSLSITHFVVCIQVIKILNRTKTNRKGNVRRKNIALLVSDVIMVILVTILVVYPFSGFRYSPWGYLAYQSVLRFMELVLSCFFFMSVESYFLYKRVPALAYIFSFSSRFHEDATGRGPTKSSKVKTKSTGQSSSQSPRESATGSKSSTKEVDLTTNKEDDSPLDKSKDEESSIVSSTTDSVSS